MSWPASNERQVLLPDPTKSCSARAYSGSEGVGGLEAKVAGGIGAGGQGEWGYRRGAVVARGELEATAGELLERRKGRGNESWL